MSSAGLIFFINPINVLGMARPQKPKNVCQQPKVNLFKPAGKPMAGISPISLTLDEYEAIRLADLEGLYQEEAADLMNTSRQTFARIVESAHRKVAEALVKGLPLLIEGGTVNLCDDLGGCKGHDYCLRRELETPGSSNPDIQ